MSVLSPKRTSCPPESGMIAIMVTLIMMIVISLLVLGFAQVSRHEQRNTLDNQLSSQAYYAAESGVNDAVSAIRLKLDTGKVPAKKKCNDSSNYNFTTSSQLGPDVSYSCVLIDPAPLELHYSVGSDPVVVPLESGSGVTFKTITVSWTPIKLPDGTYPSNPLSGCLNTAGSLPPMAGSGAWSCGYSMLRTEMVPTTVLSRGSLLANSKVNFLEPVVSGSGTAASTVGGKVIGAKCVNGAKPTCQVEFSGFTGPDYYMRLSAIYGTTNVTISSTDPIGPVGIEGAQVDIDATGNAHGVLRRVLVAVDLTDANKVRLPSAALAVGDTICKRFEAANGIFTVPATYPGGNGNPLCESASVSPPSTTPPPSTTCAAPKDVMLTLDESASMQDEWDRGISRENELKNISIQFVQDVTKTSGMDIGVVRFDSSAKLLEPLTNDYTAVEDAIRNMQWEHGGTHYDAGLTMTQTAFKDARGGSVPKVMIFISDGRPDGGATYAQIISQTDNMKQSGISIYTIGIYPGDQNTGILQQMSSGSGYYTEAETAEQMQSFFQKIAGDLSC